MTHLETWMMTYFIIPKDTPPFATIILLVLHHFLFVQNAHGARGASGGENVRQDRTTV